MLAGGVSIKELAEYLGHADPGVGTLRVYARVYLDRPVTCPVPGKIRPAGAADSGKLPDPIPARRQQSALRAVHVFSLGAHGKVYFARCLGSSLATGGPAGRHAGRNADKLTERNDARIELPVNGSAPRRAVVGQCQQARRRGIWRTGAT